MRTDLWSYVKLRSKQQKNYMCTTALPEQGSMKRRLRQIITSSSWSANAMIVSVLAFTLELIAAKLSPFEVDWS